MVKGDHTARPRARRRDSRARDDARIARRRATRARGGRSSARHKRGVATARARDSRRFASIHSRAPRARFDSRLGRFVDADARRARRSSDARGFVTSRDAGDARRARDAGRARGTTTSDARDDDDDDGDGDGETRDDDEARRARERRDDARAMDDDASRTVRRDASAGDGERDG